MNDAASEQSHSTALAISCADPILLRGVCRTISAATDWSRRIQPVTGGVSTQPGRMAVMRGPVACMFQGGAFGEAKNAMLRSCISGPSRKRIPTQSIDRRIIHDDRRSAVSAATSASGFRLATGTAAPLLLISLVWAHYKGGSVIVFNFAPAFFVSYGMSLAQADAMTSLCLYSMIPVGPFGGWLFARSQRAFTSDHPRSWSVTMR
jgi:hypothetical protein